MILRSFHLSYVHHTTSPRSPRASLERYNFAHFSHLSLAYILHFSFSSRFHLKFLMWNDVWFELNTCEIMSEKIWRNVLEIFQSLEKIYSLSLSIIKEIFGKVWNSWWLQSHWIMKFLDMRNAFMDWRAKHRRYSPREKKINVFFKLSVNKNQWESSYK